MKIVNVPFQSGSQRINHRYQDKTYHPYLYRFGIRCYAGHGRLWFHNATAAQEYARRWAERAGRFLKVKEIVL